MSPTPSLTLTHSHADIDSQARDDGHALVRPILPPNVGGAGARPPVLAVPAAAAAPAAAVVEGQQPEVTSDADARMDSAEVRNRASLLT